MRSLKRALLAALFLFAQSALALHHHGEGVSLRAADRSHSATAVSAHDDCALCAYQIQPRTSTPEPVAVAASSVSVTVLSDVPASIVRAARAARLSARAPPASA